MPFEFHGIDPDLFFDDDGRTVIRQAEIDLTTGKLVTEARDVWAGTGGNCPEGPHLYKKNGWYYLMIAEGGTHRRHKVAMARHGGQLVWALMLARRELGERGASYPLGRETYMVPVEWPEGEFPIFEPVQLRHYLPASRRSIVGAKQRIPGFESPAAAIKLRLTDTELGATAGSPTFVGQRQTALESTAKAEIDLASAAKTGHAGLAVYKDPFRYASVDVDLAAGRVSVNLGHAAQELTTSNSKPLAGAAAIKLTIETSVETYSFPYSTFVDGQWSPEASPFFPVGSQPMTVYTACAPSEGSTRPTPMDANEYWCHHSVTPDSYPSLPGLKLILTRNVSLYLARFRNSRAGDSGLLQVRSGKISPPAYAVRSRSPRLHNPLAANCLQRTFPCPVAPPSTFPSRFFAGRTPSRDRLPLAPPVLKHIAVPRAWPRGGSGPSVLRKAHSWWPASVPPLAVNSPSATPNGEARIIPGGVRVRPVGRSISETWMAKSSRRSPRRAGAARHAHRRGQMAAPGKNSEVEVERKYGAGAVDVAGAGTT
ncbi:hypothetical protein L209DRAFT_746174 [Thermothelomyces heterothallicus CBS 203.75]